MKTEMNIYIYFMLRLSISFLKKQEMLVNEGV